MFGLIVSFSTYVTGQVKIEPEIYKKANNQRMNQWVDSVMSRMTLDEKIGQTIMVMADGGNTESNKRLLTGFVKNQHVGSIIFSKGTAQNQAELTNLCQRNAKIPLMVALDGEWGLSMRLSNTTRFPQNMMLGAIQEDSLIYMYGQEVARQCREMGIHVNFAPDMDVNSNPANPVIGRRSFGEDPRRVAKQGILYSKGLEDGGVLSVTKHFPGHGDTSTDSHNVLPLIQHTRQRLDSIEIYPFKEYINAGLGGVMIGHLNIPALDKSGLPSSLSKPIVTGLLQNELGFSGLIFTDGLAMKGVSGEPDMAVKILQAGNDILLGPISPVKEYNALKAAVAKGTLSESVIDERCRKILIYKYLLNVQNTPRIDTRGLSSRLNTSHAEWLTRKLNQKAITLVKNQEGILPLKNLDKNKIAAVSIGASANNAFHRNLKLYDNVTCFNVADASALSQLKSRLNGFSTIIVSVHANKTVGTDIIQSIFANKKGVMVFFTSPYRISSYRSAIANSNAVVVGYENTDFAQEYAARAIFGGYGFEGKLPVSVRGIFDMGTGISTVKTRLSYNLPEEVGIRAYKLNGIADIAMEGIKEKGYPGCQILIAKDGVVIYNESFGTFEYGKNRKVTNEDIYDLASMTKATATIPAIMKLYDEKKIRLQDPLSKYVGALRGTDKSNITVREALFHESGLTSFIPYYLPAIDKNSYFGKLYSNKPSEIYDVKLDDNTWARTDYKYKPQLISKTPKQGYELQIADNLYANPAYKDTIINAIAKSKLRAKKSYLYSCLNFILLKEAAENITKIDQNTFLQQNFFRKLGAVTTTYNPLKKFDKDEIAPTERDGFLRKQLLQGYVHDEGAAFMGGISGNAGLFSNANDLAKLYQMWLNSGEYGGERLLSKETCRLFTTAKSSQSRRGLGFDKPEPSASKSNPCSPSTPVSTYGHTGFTGTCFWIDPDNKLIYIFLSNRVYDTRTHKNLMKLNIRTRIQEEIYNAMR